jgi:hypothetical protein
MRGRVLNMFPRRIGSLVLGSLLTVILGACTPLMQLDPGPPRGDAGIADARPAAADGSTDPVTGPPGLDLTAGGNLSRSTKYTLLGAVGEGPGFNGVSSSPTYRLQGGVVADSEDAGGSRE